MRPKVKICGITKPDDARAATRMGADYIGVIQYPKSPRYVQPELLEDLIWAMPDGKRVLVDVEPDPAVLQKQLDIGFDYFQLHFDLSISDEKLAAWAQLIDRRRLWLAPRLPDSCPFPERLHQYADTFVIDTYKPGLFGGTGKAGSWERFAKWKATYTDSTFVLAGGLGPDNIAKAMKATGAAVVDINSGIESAPGVKNLDKMFKVMDILYKLG
jgi:phosphoribosylanthranilate isomerase